MGGARGDHLALFGRADSRGHVRCSSFLTNKIIMVDYSKWDKLDYGDDDDSDGDEDKDSDTKDEAEKQAKKNVPHFPQHPQVTKLHQPTRVTIGSGESVDFNALLLLLRPATRRTIIPQKTRR